MEARLGPGCRHSLYEELWLVNQVEERVCLKGGNHYLKPISLAAALFDHLGRRQLEAALIHSLQQGNEGHCSHRCGCRNQGMKASIDSSTNSNCIVSWDTCRIGEIQHPKNI